MLNVSVLVFLQYYANILFITLQKSKIMSNNKSTALYYGFQKKKKTYRGSFHRLVIN